MKTCHFGVTTAYTDSDAAGYYSAKYPRFVSPKLFNSFSPIFGFMSTVITHVALLIFFPSVLIPFDSQLSYQITASHRVENNLPSFVNHYSLQFLFFAVHCLVHRAHLDKKAKKCTSQLVFSLFIRGIVGIVQGVERTQDCADKTSQFSKATAPMCLFVSYLFDS